MGQPELLNMNFSGPTQPKTMRSIYENNNCESQN